MGWFEGTFGTMDTLGETLGERIRKLRKSRGMTQVALAERCKVNQATVSKWEKNKEKPSSFAAAELAAMAGQPVAAFLGLHSITPVESPTRTYRVVANLQAGFWREAIEWDHDDQYDVPVPWHPSMPDLPMKGYVVSGPSMNKVYPDGSIVFVAATISNGLRPRSGQRVIVQRRSREGLFEATLKEYIVEADGTKWLWPRSYDPEYQAPLQLNGDSDEEITITGIVMYSFIAEPYMM